MAKKRFNVAVVEKLCKACGLCIGMCPTKVFTADQYGKAVVENADACTGCLICEMHCPDFCVEVEARDNE